MENGVVYRLTAKKVTDLQALSRFVSTEGERWIREVVERQKNLKNTKKKEKCKSRPKT